MQTFKVGTVYSVLRLVQLQCADVKKQVIKQILIVFHILYWLQLQGLNVG